jgi:pimeloyl-ACP methyl ester carboxylesterase
VFDAAGVERAPLFGMSQGCAIACAFAARRPDRVSGLIFYGGFAQGRARRSRPEEAETAKALWALAQVAWHDAYPSVRDHFARLIFPDVSEEEQRAFAELMRDMISPDVFRETRSAVDQFDVTGILPDIQCPALVLHSQNDRLQPIDQGRMLAAGLPNARFVALPFRNHLLTPHDAAWPMAEREIRSFLERLP